jgi:hypothetical protein
MSIVSHRARPDPDLIRLRRSQIGFKVGQERLLQLLDHSIALSFVEDNINLYCSPIAGMSFVADRVK